MRPCHRVSTDLDDEVCSPSTVGAYCDRSLMACSQWHRSTSTSPREGHNGALTYSGPSPITWASQVPLNDSLHHLEESPFKAIMELAKYTVTGQGAFSRPFQNSSTFVPSRLLDDDGSLSNKDSHELDATVPENRPDIELMHIAHDCGDYDVSGKGIYSMIVTLIPEV